MSRHKKGTGVFLEQRVKEQKINNCGGQSSQGKWHAFPRELRLKLLSSVRVSEVLFPSSLFTNFLLEHILSTPNWHNV